MMLLAAVVLIFAFLALSAMVSRVSQLASVTSQDQDRPILLEVDAVQAAVDDLVLDLQAITPALNATTTPTLQGALESGLRHLAHLERARGFRFEDTGTNTNPYDEFLDCTADRIVFRLSDGEVQVDLVSQETFTC